jgi:hypothetical protein
MNSDPFGTFEDYIIGRRFDRFQPGLISRWAGHDIDYKLTYGPPTGKPCLVLDYGIPDAVGRVTLWVSGESDFEVISGSRGDILRETHVFDTTRDFHSAYPIVPLTLMKLRGDDMSMCRIELPD